MHLHSGLPDRHRHIARVAGASRDGPRHKTDSSRWLHAICSRERPARNHLVQQRVDSTSHRQPEDQQIAEDQIMAQVMVTMGAIDLRTAELQTVAGKDVKALQALLNLFLSAGDAGEDGTPIAPLTVDGTAGAQTKQDAERRNNPVFSLGFALFWAPGVFLWVGDLHSAEEYANRLISNGERHFRTYECDAGRGYKGALAIGRGDAAAGVEDLQACLEQLHAVRYEMLNTEFKVLLVQGLMAIGRLDEARTLIDDVIGLMAENGDLLHMPGALRVKGNVLLSRNQRRADNAETFFHPIARLQPPPRGSIMGITDRGRLGGAVGRKWTAQARPRASSADHRNLCRRPGYGRSESGRTAPDDAAVTWLPLRVGEFRRQAPS